MLNIAAAVIANIQVYRLTLLYGPSGAGKTAMLKNNVIPQLQAIARNNLQTNDCAAIIPVYCNHWQSEPADSLAQAVAEGMTECSVQGTEWAAGSSLSRYLHIQSEITNGDVLLVLDQFEQFLQRRDDTGPGTFADDLVTILTTPDMRVNILLCLREDALARLDLFKGRIPFLLNNRLSMEKTEKEGQR